MSDDTRRGRADHRAVEVFERGVKIVRDEPETFPATPLLRESTREHLHAATVIRDRCESWCERRGYTIEELPIVGPHECRESTACRCRMDADEPNEACPVHGSGPYPPKCAECGRYMRRKGEERRGYAMPEIGEPGQG